MGGWEKVGNFWHKTTGDNRGKQEHFANTVCVAKCFVVQCGLCFRHENENVWYFKIRFVSEWIFGQALAKRQAPKGSSKNTAQISVPISQIGGRGIITQSSVHGLLRKVVCIKQLRLCLHHTWQQRHEQPSHGQLLARPYGANQEQGQGNFPRALNRRNTLVSPRFSLVIPLPPVCPVKHPIFLRFLPFSCLLGE